MKMEALWRLTAPLCPLSEEQDQAARIVVTIFHRRRRGFVVPRHD